jgi:UDP-N-acetylmuramoyl-L-alanyl-D-glutamate--2,6-diaminopimelate ligase
MTNLPLSQLLIKTEQAHSQIQEQMISGITADSRAVKPGFLFAALPGTKHDGRTYISEAINKGAAALLVPAATELPADAAKVSVIIAREPRLTLAQIAAAFYARMPGTIAAVTGTNGKTSTAQFTRQIWAALGKSAASIGTLGIISPQWTHDGSLTTPDAITLHKTLDQLAGNGVTHLAMEASSHGLSMYRLDAVKVKTAGFTNLTRDHLDFHGTMESYFAAKARLFDEVLASGGVAVLNADTPQATTLAELAHKVGRKTISYGEAGHDLKLLALTPQSHGQLLSLDIMGKKYEILMPVAGKFQTWNALCALGMVIAAGESNIAAAVEALGKISGVRGRLELVGTHPSGASIFVDYAHTPDALETVLTAIKPHVDSKAGGKLLVVFGCGGNRDRGKRPVMGEIAQRLAERVIVTDDNPRKEVADEIRREILTGCRPDKNLSEIGDRAAAIQQAIKELRRGDVLIIAGKGHEPGQIVGDVVLPFDDATVAQQALREGAA